LLQFLKRNQNLKKKLKIASNKKLLEVASKKIVFLKERENKYQKIELVLKQKINFL